MKKMINYIRSVINSIRPNAYTWLFYGLLMMAGIAGIWVTYNYAIAFSDYFIVLVFVAVFFGIFHWFDRHLLRSIDTITELKNGNIAYALFLIAIALLVLAGALTVS